MDSAEISKFLGNKEMTIMDALGVIDANTWGVMYVVDEEERLVGCITDGDVRRGLMQRGDLSMKISEIMNSSPRYVHEKARNTAVKIMADSRITSLPILDDNHHITDIILFNTKVDAVLRKARALSDYAVIIMAGGEGTRLQPYTKILPKPLIPIGDVPIIERVIEQFYSFGVSKFFVTVNFKKKMIESYFAESDSRYDISYVEENKPLGTAGSIRLIKEEVSQPIFVTNCDILIDSDYELIMDFHKKSGNMMTVVASMKNITIPYGVIHLEKEGVLGGIKEKPKLSYLINTGMYVINPEVIDYIPEDTFFHMTDLIQKIVDDGKKVSVYPVSEEAFMDMGEFEEMRKMEEKLKIK